MTIHHFQLITPPNIRVKFLHRQGDVPLAYLDGTWIQMLRLSQSALQPTLRCLSQKKFRGLSSNATPNAHLPTGQSLNLAARNQLEAIDVRDQSVIDVSRLKPSILGTLAGLPRGDFIIYPGFLSIEEQQILLKASLTKLGGKRGRPRRASGAATLEPVEYKFEEGHFDGVIRDYREMTVSSWPDSSPLDLSRILLRLYELVDPGNTPTNPGLTTPPNIQTHILHLASTGVILPHVDNVEASGSVIAEDTSFDVLLESGSVYIQRKDIRYKWKHEIPNVAEFGGRKVGGGQRISVMLRDKYRL
ncbi:hypothetical protein OPQ81_001522 [Rhizoctonia solani]|nr:hypothetical protein OPQ81_001522 [Rhizoctonia solani]